MFLIKTFFVCVQNAILQLEEPYLEPVTPNQGGYSVVFNLLPVRSFDLLQMVSICFGLSRLPLIAPTRRVGALCLYFLI